MSYSNQLLHSKSVVVIPARNEEPSIGNLIERLLHKGLPVIVVDDYSSDQTASRASEAGAKVLKLPFHAGAWFAMQTGIRAACQDGFSTVITMDADGQHDPESIDILLSALEDSDQTSNVVIGSCIERGNRRRQWAWRVLRWISGLNLADMTSGFRAYDSEAMAVVADPSCTLIEYQDIGILLRLVQSGLTIREVEVSMQSRAHGQSRIFRSWLTVSYYLVYSFLLSISKRRYIPEKQEQRRPYS